MDSIGEKTRTIGEKLLPYIKPQIQRAIDFISGINLDKIITDMQDFALTIKEQVTPIIDYFREYTDQLNAVLVGLATVGLVMVIGGMWLLVAPFVAFLPVALAVAGVIGGLFYLFQTNQDVQNFVNGAWTFLIQAFMYAKDVVLPQLIIIFSQIWDVITTQVLPSVVSLWQTLVQFWAFVSPVLIPILQFLAITLGVVIVGAVFGLLYAVKFLLDGINLFLQGFMFVVNGVGYWTNYLKNNFWETVGFIIGFFATLPIKVVAFVISMIWQIGQFLSNVNWMGMLVNLAFAFYNTFNTVFQWLKNINWGEMIGGAGKSVGNAIIGMIEGALRGALSGIPGVPQVKLPRFENGGIVGGNSMSGDKILARVNSGELILNRGQQDRLANQLTNNTVNNTPTINNYFTINGYNQDSRSLTDMIIREINKQTQMSSLGLNPSY